jgi:hypothetical protein
MIDNENGFENLEKSDWEQLIDSFVTILKLIKKIIGTTTAMDAKAYVNVNKLTDYYYDCLY